MAQGLRGQMAHVRRLWIHPSWRRAGPPGGGNAAMCIAVTNQALFVSGDNIGDPLNIMLGNGNGTFQKATTFASGLGANQAGFNITVADINADGVQDVVFASETSSVIVILGNCDGTFQAPITYSGNPGGDTNVRSLTTAVADLNGDGKMDIVLGQNTLTPGIAFAGVLLGNGNGTFGAPQSFSFGTGPYAGESIAVADLDGDGNIDIAECHTQHNQVTVLLGNGNGTFKAKQTYATGLEPYFLAIADLNGDGKLDLVTANADTAHNTPSTNAKNISVLLGNGNGTFQAQQTFASGGFEAKSVAIADFDGDGKLDIAVGNTTNVPSVGILIGNGNGTFKASVTYSPYTFGGYTVGNVVAADLNGDGVPDLVVPAAGGRYCSIMMGNGNGTFQKPLLSTGTLAYNVSQYTLRCAVTTIIGKAQPASFTVTAPSAVSQSIAFPFTVKATRQNSTTSTTYTGTVHFSGGGSGATLPANGTLVNGIGTFTATLSTIGSQKITVTDRAFGVVTGASSAISVLALDLIVADATANQVAVLLGNGNGTFGAKVGFTLTSASVLDAADLDADGNVDVACFGSGGSIHVLLGNGNGTFKAQATAGNTSLTGQKETVLADVNGDGIKDLITGSSGAFVAVNLGNGNGTFQAAKTFAAGAGTYVPWPIAVADLNGDGKPEIIVTASNVSYANSIAVLMGNGDGTFQAQKTFAIGAQSEGLIVADLNGDGIPDLAAACYGAYVSAGNPYNLGGVYVLLGNGNGTFKAATVLATPNTLATAGLEGIAVADINGDGKPDLMVALRQGNGPGSAGAVGIFLGNGNGTFQAMTTIACAGQPFVIHAADLNGDGNVDLAVTPTAYNTVAVILGNGNGTFRAPQTFATGAHTSQHQFVIGRTRNS